jgi:hypothetical protein
MEKLTKAFELFDNYNKQDPRKVTWEGKEYPVEYFYALQLHNWLLKLESKPGESLMIASRCQHIGRWKIPRNQYPAGKAGYLRWRKDLAQFHASTAENLLTQAGYGRDEIDKVMHILLKENLKNDAEVQSMENALCLVFLEFQLGEFMTRHDDNKVIRILQKSWKKMSDPGKNAALTLSFTPEAKALLEKAVL